MLNEVVDVVWLRGAKQAIEVAPFGELVLILIVVEVLSHNLVCHQVDQHSLPCHLTEPRDLKGLTSADFKKALIPLMTSKESCC